MHSQSKERLKRLWNAQSEPHPSTQKGKLLLLGVRTGASVPKRSLGVTTPPMVTYHCNFVKMHGGCYQKLVVQPVGLCHHSLLKVQ